MYDYLLLISIFKILKEILKNYLMISNSANHFIIV